MAIDRSTFGWRVFGFGIVALGAVCLAFGDFHPGQPVPKDFPARTALAYAVAAFMLVAGLALQWRRTSTFAAAALTFYFGLVVVVVMNGSVAIAHYNEFLPYESIAIELAIASGALIVYATHANMSATRAAQLIRIGRFAFGLCAVVFGIAHFLYMSLTAPLVPKWLPPSQQFWAYATGVFHIAGGIAIFTGVLARLAAILLTMMFAAFSAMVHIPMVLAAPENHWIWNENAVNLALIGAAWVVADSYLARKTHALQNHQRHPGAAMS